MINIFQSVPKSIPRPIALSSLVRLSPRQCCNQKPECVGKSDPPLEFPCKVAVISGGTGGIGTAIAHSLFSEKIQNIALLSSDACRGREAVNMLNCCYGKGKAMFLRCDAHNKTQVTECYDKIMKEYKRIDIVVNTAGVFDGCNWEKEINTGLIGTVNNMLQGYRLMGNDSVILNVAGVTGLDPLYTAPTITAVHHGIIGLSRSFGDERNVRRTGVRVVTLCAGITNTGFTKNAGKRAMYHEWRNDLEMYLSKATRQNADVVGKSAIHVMRLGTSGSVWIIIGSKLYSLNFPHWETYRVLESQLI